MSGTSVVELQLLADASLERSHLITQLVLAVLNSRHERLGKEGKWGKRTFVSRSSASFSSSCAFINTCSSTSCAARSSAASRAACASASALSCSFARSSHSAARCCACARLVRAELAARSLLVARISCSLHRRCRAAYSPSSTLVRSRTRRSSFSSGSFV